MKLHVLSYAELLQLQFATVGQVNDEKGVNVGTGWRKLARSKIRPQVLPLQPGTTRWDQLLGHKFTDYCENENQLYLNHHLQRKIQHHMFACRWRVS